MLAPHAIAVKKMAGSALHFPKKTRQLESAKLSEVDFH